MYTDFGIFRIETLIILASFFLIIFAGSNIDNQSRLNKLTPSWQNFYRSLTIPIGFVLLYPWYMSISRVMFVVRNNLPPIFERGLSDISATFYLWFSISAIMYVLLAWTLMALSNKSSKTVSATVA